MHPHQSIGLHKSTLRGFIWSQQSELRAYMFWRILSVLAITPFPVLSQRIVDVAIPADDLNGVLFYTVLSLVLLLIVLKQGECISEGSWDELAAQEGAFKDLLDAQT